MICWFEASSNEVTRNEHSVFILSSISSSKSGMEILPANFRAFIALSTARNREAVGRGNWILNPNRYLAPNTPAPEAQK
jgi:hypothetical protein